MTSAARIKAKHVRAAIKLISNPKKWTQHDGAKASDGSRIRFDDPRAVCWCAEGAIAKYAKLEDWTDVNVELGKILGKAPYLWRINDNRGRSAVIRRMETLAKLLAGLEGAA